MNRENPSSSPNAFGYKSILFNSFGRLRSGWRFLIFQLSFIFFGSALGAAVFFLLTNTSVFYDKGSVVSFIVPNIILLVPAVFCAWLCAKFLEDLPFRTLGLWFTKNWLKDLALGLITGSLSMIFAVGLAAAFGGMRLEVNQTAGTTAIIITLLVSLVVFTVGALAEEAYFRGYILQTFTRAQLSWLAIAVTSLFFASAHLNNQNANWISTLNTALAGIWLSVAYLKTRNLWFPFAVHLMWNWLQGGIFGIPVSGITSLTTAPLLRQIEPGTSLWSGGVYGIEGGIACTVAIAASTLFIRFAPFIKPAAEMLALTSGEKSKMEASENSLD